MKPVKKESPEAGRQPGESSQCGEAVTNVDTLLGELVSRQCLCCGQHHHESTDLCTDCHGFFVRKETR